MASQSYRDRCCAAIIGAVFLYTEGPPLVQTFTAPKYLQRIGAGLPPLSAQASLLTTVAVVVVIVVCVSCIVLFLRDAPRAGRVQLAVLLLPWLYLVIRDEYLTIQPRPTTFIYPLVCVATWLLRPRIASLQALGYLIGGLALLSLAIGVFAPSKGLYQLTFGAELSPDKKIFSSGLLVGPMSNANNLAQVLVMGFASVLLVRRKGWLAIMVPACVIAQVWAASRSCLLALVVLVVLGLGLRALPLRARPILVVAALTCMVIGIVTIPLVTTNPLAFSNRGFVWNVSRQALNGHEWFGLGAGFYSRIATTSENLGSTVFHGHNQFIQDLMDGGYLLAFTMGVTIAFAIGAAARLVRRGFMTPALYLAGFLGACVLEVSVSLVDRLFALPVMVIPFACILLTGDHDVPVQEEPDVRARSSELRAAKEALATAANRSSPARPEAENGLAVAADGQG